MYIHVKPEIVTIWGSHGSDYEHYCLQTTLKMEAARYSASQ
jgi:hypothetical protein